jgi:hypothetical protein
MYNKSMDEISGQIQPPENGETKAIDPDIISLPRRKFGTPQVVAVFIFLLALTCLSGVAMLLNETVILADFIEKGDNSNYVYSLIDFLSQDEAYDQLYSFYGAALNLSISAFGLIFGAIALAFSLGTGRTWTWVNVLLFPLTMYLCGICIALGRPGESEKLEFFGMAAFMLLPALVVAIILRRVVEWIAPVRDDSEQGRDRLSRSSTTRACVAILLFYSLLFIALGGGLADYIDRRVSSSYPGILYWLPPVALLIIPILALILYGIRRGRIVVIITMILITCIASLSFVAGYVNALTEVLRVTNGLKDPELYRFILGLTVTGLAGVTLLYPLYVLTILPFRRLGKELFRRVEKAEIENR